MPRYIDADALIERLGINNDCTECSYCTSKCYCSWDPDPGEICIAISELPTVTINDTSEEIKVTNCNDNISRQAICDALDKVFADRIKSAGFDSYETADRDTQLVCDGIMKAIDVVLGLPSAQPEHAQYLHNACADLISRADALSCFHDWIDQRGDVHTADEMPEYQRIENLPSAQSERKTGKWIPQDYNQRHGNISTTVYYYPKCSVCGCYGDYTDAFCKSCGADMRGDSHEID